MDIVVLIKQVPDTATRIQDRVVGGAINLDGVTWVVNPYDEYAAEEALRLREAHGGSVTLLALGPDRVQSALKAVLALGADEAIQVWDPAFEGIGPRARAKVLAAALRKLPHDLVWAGWKGVDDDEGVVPIYMAHELGLPHVSFVTKVELAGDKATLRREVEGGHEVVTTPLPAVLTAQKGLNEVRYANLKGIMAVKKKEIPVWNASDLGIDASSLPPPGIRQLEVTAPPARTAGRKIAGAPDEAARELVRLLREEAKVI